MAAIRPDLDHDMPSLLMYAKELQLLLRLMRVVFVFLSFLLGRCLEEAPGMKTLGMVCIS